MDVNTLILNYTCFILYMSTFFIFFTKIFFLVKFANFALFCPKNHKFSHKDRQETKNTKKILSVREPKVRCPLVIFV